MDELKRYFPNDQGWELFKAACALANQARAELAKARGDVTTLSLLKTPDLSDAISKALRSPTIAGQNNTAAVGADPAAAPARVRKELFTRPTDPTLEKSKRRETNRELLQRARGLRP